MATGWYPDARFRPVGIASGEAFGAAHMVYLESVANAGQIVSAEAFGSTTVILGKTLAPTAIISQEALGTPNLVYPQFLSTTGIPTGEAQGSTTVILGNILFPP